MPYLQVAKRLSTARADLAQASEHARSRRRSWFLFCLASCAIFSAPSFKLSGRLLAADNNQPADVERVHDVAPASQLPATQTALHQRIDALVHQAAIGPLAPLAADADILRRIYLDLTGVIPTSEQARVFLADTAQDKRRQLIDQLLQSADFNRHFAVQWNTVLLDRRTEKYVDQKAWERYLIGSLADQKPFDQMLRELVYPDSLGDELTPARKFLLIRDAEPHAMTRDVGRLLFGMDFQCAQCHDHPLIDDYFQADYYGLFAFLNRTKLFEDPQSKAGKLAELADGEAQYESVFTGDSDSAARPRLPRGSSIFSEPVYSEAEAYVVKPEKTAAAKPKYSRRETLANRLAENPQFRRNLANRLWAILMGRGLVHPQDFHFAENPATNPQLLELLADDWAQHNFDLRYAVRQLVSTQTYQRDCTPPPPETINLSDIAARHSQLSQQLSQATAEQPRLDDAASAARVAWRAALEANAQVIERMAAVQIKLSETEKQSTAADAELSQAQADLAQQLERAASITKVLTTTRNALAQLDDEQALHEAVAILQQRANKLATAVEQAQTQQADKSASADTAHQAVQKLTDELHQLQAQPTAASLLADLEQAYNAASRASNQELAQRQLLERQLELCLALMAHPALVASDPQQAAVHWESIVEQWTILGQVAPLKPLTPEQLAASTMQATGFLIRSAAAARAALEKAPPGQPAQTELTAIEQNQQREVALQVELLEQLRGSISQFVAQFGGLSGEEFQATVNQALFLGNSPALSGWLVASDDTLVGRLAKLESSNQVANELTLAVLSRPATLDEQREIATFLDTPGELAAVDRAQAVAEIAWAMIASNEFRFNH